MPLSLDNAPEELSILLLEDDPVDATLTVRALEHTTAETVWKVSHAADLRTAESCLQDQHYSAIVADLGLPLASGPEVVQRLRTIAPTTPIIVLTGRNDESLALDALRVGANDFFVKSTKLDPYHLRRAIRYAVAHHDTTGRLQRANEQAQSALRAKGAFLAAMSHEIRTPMNGVLGATELLFDQPMNSSQRKLLETVRSSGEALLGIINDILDYSKVEAGGMKLTESPTDLKKLLGDTLEAVRPLAQKKKLELSLQLDSAVPAWVAIDSHRLRQMVLNFVGNALKFTQEGSIRLRVKPLAEVNGVSRARFEVVDTGSGIDEANLATLFDSFTQVEQSSTARQQGTGLGLAICKQLTLLMGGRIGVSSTLGAGSVFWFEVPLTECPAQVAVVRPLSVAPTRGSRVLVADDNSVNRMVVRGMLKSLGCEVTLVNDGSQALTALESGVFDLVLMDCYMPVLDGYEATRKIRASESDARVPVLALTASAMLEDKQACLAAGMDDFLTKPISKAALKTALRQWVWDSAAPATSGN